MRQRPGKGNAIFLTLEDEKAVANVIFWQRNFERFRPIVMGSKFVRVTGKLQSELDVIHIVAERIEDLTPGLSSCWKKLRLSAESAGAGGSGMQQMEKERDSLGPFVRKNAPVRQDIGVLTREAGSVMPKGRNFQ